MQLLTLTCAGYFEEKSGSAPFYTLDIQEECWTVLSGRYYLDGHGLITPKLCWHNQTPLYHLQARSSQRSVSDIHTPQPSHAMCANLNF